LKLKEVVVVRQPATTTTTTTTQRKGMSSTAKGALIGAELEQLQVL
jgi:hypothetical protein